MTNLWQRRVIPGSLTNEVHVKVDNFIVEPIKPSKCHQVLPGQLCTNPLVKRQLPIPDTLNQYVGFITKFCNAFILLILMRHIATLTLPIRDNEVLASEIRFGIGRRIERRFPLNGTIQGL